MPVGGYTAYTKVQRQNTAWLQHCKDGLQRKRSSLQTAFIVGSLVLMEGRLFTCFSKAVSRVQPGREGVSGDQPWSHSSAPNPVSLSDFSQRCATESSAEERWEVSPAEGKPCQAQAQAPLSKSSTPCLCQQVGDRTQDLQALHTHYGAALGLPDQLLRHSSSVSECLPAVRQALPCEPYRQGSCSCGAYICTVNIRQPGKITM